MADPASFLHDSGGGLSEEDLHADGVSIRQVVRRPDA